ncbi:uncharacterized protein LOC106531635 [Austrofundulus limnaeus]|uniref:Uncharacterized protein LOC106531635 n=1 Tax=Austrofundulus limnaeus TaxID=52670 RepID=A0A2I4CSM4_AUSLI|nr:PREDICTED: uncharacterized protein LOC106531635 [Austrofundulus limnaeus]
MQQTLHVSRPPNKLSETVTKEPENQWPAIVLERVTQIKRRLDIKGPPVRTDSPSSIDSEDEKGHISKKGQQELHTRPPIKLSQTVTKEPENQWPALNLEQVTRIKRRLDIKGPSPRPDSPSSSDSEDETTGDFRKKEQKKVNVSRPGLETSAVLTTSEKMFTQSPGVLVKNISHTPKKDHNILLEKYEVMSDDLENQPTNTACSTPEITPELQTRWATMHLGVSRFRRRLEITSPTTKPPNPPFSPPRYFPYSSSSENAPEKQPRLQRRIVGTRELVLTDSSFVPENIPQNRSPTLKDPHNKVSFPFEVKPSVTGKDKTKADTILVDLSSQDIKRYQDIWVDEKTLATTSQRYSSSLSSDSKEETTNPCVPDIKKYLNIKTPSPEPNNTQAFFSQGEKDGTKYSEMQSRQTLTKLETTDESLITYKRSIIKTSSLPKNYFIPAGSSQAVDHTFIAQRVDSYRNTSHSPRLDTSMNFDDRPTTLNTDVALQHEIRWMGVGHHLSGFSNSNPASMNAVLPTLQQASLAEPRSLPFEDSSSTSVTDKMQDSGKLDKILMNKYSSLDSESASPPSIGTFDLFGISPASMDKKEKKGLGALKIMSLERRLWEKDLSKDPSLPTDDSGSQDDNFSYSQFEKDTKISSKEPVKLASTSSLDKKRDADLLLLYGIPRYIRHDIKAPVQDTVPESPLPDD